LPSELVVVDTFLLLVVEVKLRDIGLDKLPLPDTDLELFEFDEIVGDLVSEAELEAFVVGVIPKLPIEDATDSVVSDDENVGVMLVLGTVFELLLDDDPKFALLEVELEEIVPKLDTELLKLDVVLLVLLTLPVELRTEAVLLDEELKLSVLETVVDVKLIETALLMIPLLLVEVWFKLDDIGGVDALGTRSANVHKTNKAQTREQSLKDIVRSM